MNDFEEDEKIINKRIREVSTGIDFKTLLLKIITIIILLFIVFNYMYGFIRMQDNTMEPFISEGQLLLYYRIDKDYKVGDVVVVKYNGKKYVSRIIAKEGQEVKITEEGKLLVDGFPESNQSSLYPTEIPEDSKISYPYRVPANSYFIVGDYSVEINDSRIFGAVPFETLKGKVISSLKIRNI